MKRILAPLKRAGELGINITSGDGIIHRGHPILATYVGDYPEQLLVTCCKNGDCPKCSISREEIGESMDTSRELRELDKVHDALSAIDQGPTAFTQACKDVGIKPIMHPFWEDLPYVNIFVSITPDILHQLYQGVIKHVVDGSRKLTAPRSLMCDVDVFPPITMSGGL